MNRPVNGSAIEARQLTLRLCNRLEVVSQRQECRGAESKLRPDNKK